MNAPFQSLEDLRHHLSRLPMADAAALEAARRRNGMLTKPPGALGRLEEVAIWYASWRGEAAPRIEQPQVIVFAANHGVTARGVSAFPAEVTAQMVLNFEAGGAAINQLASCFGARMDVVALELDRPTQDFSKAPAMSAAEVVAALNVGWQAVESAADLLVVGEMGIGNTTSAAALANAVFGGAAEDWVGRGTGVSDEGLKLKAQVVNEALVRHADILRDPLEVLRCLGGREIAAMAGAILRARDLSIPVILDGFICTAAAAVLERAQSGALDHCVAGHVSAEGGHAAMLERLGKAPLLALDLRLGEGSGGALAIGILQGAVACHSGMATFEEAGVSDG